MEKKKNKSQKTPCIIVAAALCGMLVNIAAWEDRNNLTWKPHGLKLLWPFFFPLREAPLQNTKTHFK